MAADTRETEWQAVGFVVPSDYRIRVVDGFTDSSVILKNSCGRDVPSGTAGNGVTA